MFHHQSMPEKYKIRLRSVSGFSLISTVLVIGVGLTAMTFLGHLWWGFELATHFRVQYVAIFSILILVMAIKRRWVDFGLSLTCLIIHAVAILPVYIASQEAQAQQSSERIKIMHSNVRSSNTNYQQVLDLIAKESPEVVVLQEVNQAWLRSLKPLEDTYPYRHRVKAKYYERLVLYSQIPMETTREKSYRNYQVPILIVNLNLNSHPLTIYAAHLTAPSTPAQARARNHELEMLAKEINSTKEPVILIGDLNTTPWSPYFSKLIRETGLKDSRNGFGIQASWPTHILPFLIPLDHCLVHPSIQVRDRRLGPNIGSDHYPLFVELDLT